MKLLRLLACGLFVLGLFPVRAFGAETLRILTTLPEFAEIARDLGEGTSGFEVQAESLLRGPEDPHFVEALPSFVKRASRADLVVPVGLELEAAWLVRVLAKSGRAQVQTGGEGFCELGPAVEVLERPSGPVTRAMGDVHASGNPHFYLSPLHLVSAAQRLSQCMTRLRPEAAATFAANLARFEKRMRALHQELSAKLNQALGANSAAPTPSASGAAATASKSNAGAPVTTEGRALAARIRFIEFHREFTYLFAVYGTHMQSMGTIEEKPGVPPSAARIARVATTAKQQNVRLALAGLYHPQATLEKFTELSGVPHRRWPTMLQVDDPKFDKIEKLQRFYIEQILLIVQNKPSSP